MSLALAIGALATGCGGPGTVREDIATYSREGPGGNAALLSGELRSEGDCVVLVDDVGTIWIPVFPDDVAWNGDGAEIGGEHVQIGAAADLPGGEGTRRDPNWQVPAGARARLATGWSATDAGQFAAVTDSLRSSFPEIAAMLEAAEADLIGFAPLSREHCQKVWSNNRSPGIGRDVPCFPAP